jgi:c-di-AMP phosphodiesterase-like protein
VLERVRQSIAERLAATQLPAFTVSFGIASSDQAGDFQQLVDLADQALLRAKADGRDQVVIAGGDNQLSTDGVTDKLILPLNPQRTERPSGNGTAVRPQLAG